MKIKKKMDDPEKIKQLCQERAEREKQAGEKCDDEKTTLYPMRYGYLCRDKKINDGIVSIRLCNFSAEITSEAIVDNGLDQTSFYGIEGKLHGKTPLKKLEIPSANFAGMSWISRWGAGAVLEPGQTTKDFVRHSIQIGSPDILTTTFYGHTGWRTIDGKNLYLHAGGAIGANGGVSVKLPPELTRYAFPPAPLTDTNQAERVKAAIVASLGFLDIGKRSITMPLFSFIFLAPLASILSPMPNFSFFLHGASGSFKSSIAVLALNFFGSFPGIENLSNFDDSDGALEMRAFALKDSVLVIDDLHPSSNRAAALLREGRLQRIIRSFGNRTARARLNADLTSKNRYPPRGLLLITGEEQAALESSIARLCTVEITNGAVSKANLSALQDRVELLPIAMRSYIEWLAAHMSAVVSDFPARFKELRAEATGEGLHGRLPEQAAFLQYAMLQVTSWLVDSGVISDTGAGDLLSESWDVFRSMSAAQQRRIGEDDPVAMFVDVMATLLSQNTVRLLPVVAGGGEQIGAGEIIGHYDDEHVFLNPTGAWHSLQRFCIMEGTHFPFSKNTFFQMLKTRGIIQPSSTGDYGIVRKIGGKSCRVLKIIGGGLYEKCIAIIAN